MAVEELRLTAQDGYPLAATRFGPQQGARRNVLILAATGVPQDYYRKFAVYLAARGFTALTFDYRGIGRSRQGSLRGSAARMRDWALLDAAAAFQYLQSKDLLVVGHSFGGQALGLLPEPDRIRAALVVGSQSGYWRNWPLRGRLWMWPATHVFLPLIPRVMGYFPGSRLGFGEDLPAGVAIEWARWCRHPRYLVGDLQADAAFARLRAPLRAYAISDDAFAPPSAVQRLLELYPNARGEMRLVRPADVGASALGHFAFFRERFHDTLWREAVDWLEAHPCRS